MRWARSLTVNRVAALISTLALLPRLVAAAAPIDPPPLIQIGVEVVEVDEQKTEKLGIRWIDTILVQESNVPAVLKVGTFARSKITAALQALIQEGAADLLANPKLVARDGGTASFHAGGELPYAVAGTLGTVTIEFKQYGINLKINPKLDNGRIALSVLAEVSGPDDNNSVSLAGNTVPGIRSRQVSSEVTLVPGNTLTMAGLIQNQKQTIVVGVPGLMRIPWLGVLFRHKTLTNQRTSIVVFVTPTLLDGTADEHIPS
jgi:pilus assembly protein CpaC